MSASGSPSGANEQRASSAAATWVALDAAAAAQRASKDAAVLESKEQAREVSRLIGVSIAELATATPEALTPDAIAKMIANLVEAQRHANNLHAHVGNVASRSDDAEATARNAHDRAIRALVPPSAAPGILLPRPPSPGLLQHFCSGNRRVRTRAVLRPRGACPCVA